MKIKILILLLLILSCSRSDYINEMSIKDITPIKHVSIYDERLKGVKDRFCVIDGYFDYMYFHQQCKIKNGNIYINTKNSIDKKTYYVYMKVYLHDTLFIQIKEIKEVYLSRQ